MIALNRFIQDRIVVLKTIVHGLCLVPGALLVAGAFGVAGMDLGANPVERLIHELGNWGLKFLLVTLAVTPLRELTGVIALTRFRRMLGLYAFFYLVMHFMAYAVIDHRGDLARIVEDVIERPFITLGMLGLLGLLPLAATSTRRLRRRMGRSWNRLHRLVYPIAILGVWHFWWQVKQDILEPALFAAVLALLLGWRLWRARRGRPAHAAASS